MFEKQARPTGLPLHQFQVHPFYSFTHVVLSETVSDGRDDATHASRTGRQRVNTKYARMILKRQGVCVGFLIVDVFGLPLKVRSHRTHKRKERRTHPAHRSGGDELR
jgi:hypothetical protein